MIYYDFHIHTCLSPCGDEDMTPCNIIGLAKLLGLDAIAITDHNAIGNCRACVEAGKREGLTVLCGMEVETAENVHIVTLFPNIECAERAHAVVEKSRFKIKNKTEIYGEQQYRDSNDDIIGYEPNLLITATELGVYDMAKFAQEYGGVAFPAHVDRTANGLIQILGDINEDMGFKTVEVSATCPKDFAIDKRGYLVVHNSDAHYLENINQKSVNFLPVDADERTIIQYLQQGVKNGSK